MGEMDEDGFAQVGEIARQAVGEKIRAMLQPAQMLNSADAQQAVILGALGACVECFVCAAREDISRERLKQALREVVSDFVDQTKDQLVAGIQ